MEASVFERLSIIDISHAIPNTLRNKGYKVAKLTPAIISNMVRKINMLQTINKNISVNFNAIRNRLATYGIVILDTTNIKNRVVRLSGNIKAKALKLIPDYMEKISNSWKHLIQNNNRSNNNDIKVEQVQPINTVIEPTNNQKITMANDEENNIPKVSINQDGSRVVDYGNGQVEVYSKEGTRIDDAQAQYNIAPQTIIPTVSANDDINKNRVDDLIERNKRLETDLSAERIRVNQLEAELQEEKNRPSTQLDHIERVVLEVRDSMNQLVPSLRPLITQGINIQNNDTINDSTTLNNDHHLLK